MSNGREIDPDFAAAMTAAETQALVPAARSKPFVEGAPGVCDECEQESPRLVAGRCARCRDGRR